MYQHLPPIYGLYKGFIGQYGVMFWEQLLGYPKFPFDFWPHGNPDFLANMCWRVMFLRLLGGVYMLEQPL